MALHILPAASMSQQRVVLQLHCLRPHVTAVQGPNFSWLGYPADTTPSSSRDLLPGLTAQQQQQDDEQGADNDQGSELQEVEVDDDDDEQSGPAEGGGDAGSDEGSEASGVSVVSRGSSQSQQGLGTAGRGSDGASSGTVSTWKQQVGWVLHLLVWVRPT